MPLLNVLLNNMPPLITCEVAYAKPQPQWVLSVALPSNSSVQEAIQQSGILSLCPEIDLNQQKVGIFGELVSLTHIVKTGDRIEIYRPLLIDPITRRFERVKAAREQHVSKKT